MTLALIVFQGRAGDHNDLGFGGAAAIGAEWQRRLGLLAGHYRADRSWSDRVLEEANARLHRWRTATALPAAPDAADVLARVRQYLADDLDTPKAIAALDGWATDALEYGGHDTEAARTVATAVDALLGVQL